MHGQQNIKGNIGIT